MPTPVIDMWAPIVPVPEVMRHTVDNFPDAMLGYLRVFFKIEPTQDAMSKNMNASAFSCGVSGDVEQPLGNMPKLDESDATCMSENTTLPQR